VVLLAKLEVRRMPTMLSDTLTLILNIFSVSVWNSGILLTRLLDKMSQNNPSILKDKNVFELGCGVALASIAAAKLGAASVYATDNNPEVLSLAQRNIERNNASNAKTALLQWGLLDAFDFERSADIIIGSDLTYNPNTWRALAESMVTILKSGGNVIYLSLGHSGFNAAGELSGFTSVAENVGLKRANSNDIEKMVSQVLNQDERKIIDANGGVRVLLFVKR
jgi:predicted nicotinamide N-methyase